MANDDSPEKQAETLGFLRTYLAAASGGAPVEAIETHISLVLLAGDHVLKLKRAIRLPYVDFGSPKKRLAACRRELELNRPGAPALYRRVRRITRATDGGLAFDGDGVLVDAVVEMARFDEAGLFDNLARHGRLDSALLTSLARRLAAFHARVPVATNPGGAWRLAGVIDGVERDLAVSGRFAAAEIAGFVSQCRSHLARLAPLLDARASAGRVRRGHGDLHLRNICLVGGEPTLFDALEFDEALATTDVLYDLAFLLMDLWHRDLRAEANLVLNRYLDQAGEKDGDERALPALPLMMAVRAAIRAHIAARQATEAGHDDARSYFAVASDLLRPRHARLVAVGGFSGSGKSTVAAALAPDVGPPPGARVLASDRIRKALFGVPAETRLPADAYRPEVSADVYARMIARAGAIASSGYGAIADAVFDRADERGRIADAAGRAGVPFIGLWLEVDPSRLEQRVRERRGDVSDATPQVLSAQLAHGTVPIEWIRIAAGDDPVSVSRAAAQAITDAAISVPAASH